TRGEAGEDTSGSTSSPEELAAVREVELRSAARVLGARDIVLLDFADSGLNGSMPAGALSAVDLESVVVPVADVIQRVPPNVDVTDVASTRRAGIAEHTTQTGPFEGISDELMDEILAHDYFIRVVPPWDGGPVETSLFG